MLSAFVAHAPNDIADAYYFATPKITTNKGPIDNSLLERYRAFYVSLFRELIKGLARRTRLTHVFYPSTTFIESNEPGFAEYVQAKLEGEAICRELERDTLRVVSSRLPMLDTDQTKGLTDREFPDSLAVLSTALRAST